MTDAILQRARTAGVVACLVGFLLAAGFVSSQCAVAQDGTRSHRRLELPDGGASDLQRQMLMMQQLKSLVDNRQKNGAESTMPEIDPKQVKAFQDLLKSVGGGLSPGRQPDPSMIPPGLLSAVMSDPAMQQQVRNALEHFRQTGQMPGGNTQPNSTGLPLPPRGNRYPTNGTSQPARPARPGTDEPAEPYSKEVHNTDDFLKMADDIFKGYREKLSGRETSPRSPTPQSANQSQANSPGTARPGQNMAGRQLPESNQQWIDFLDDLVKRQQQGNASANPNNARPIPNGLRQSSSRSPGQNSNASSPNTNGTASASNPRTGSLPSMEQFLRDMQGVPLSSPPNPQSGNARSGIPSSEPRGASGSRPSKPNNSAATELAESRKVQETIQQTKEQLQQEGFQRTLRQIVRNAQKEARSGTGTGAVRSSGGGPLESLVGNSPQVEGALLRAVDGIREDVVELVKEGKVQFRDLTGSRSRPSPRGSRRSSNSGSTLGNFQRRANNFFKGLTNSPGASPGPRPSVPSTTASSPLFGSSGGLTMIVILIGLIVGGILIAREMKKSAGGTAMSDAARHQLMGKIETKADLVRAFHAMALKPTRNTEDWWTHQKFVTELVQDSPEHRDSVSVLADLYEQARYQPDDYEFTQSQIERARQAMRQCEK